MIAGLSIENFTILHVAISLVGIHNRNAGGDEAVFDRGRARLVFPKSKHFGHLHTPCDCVHGHSSDALLRAPSIASR